MPDVSRSLLTVLAVASVVTLVGCATVATTPAPTVAHATLKPGASVAIPEGGTTVADQAAAVFARDLYESATHSSSQKEAATAFRSGRALLDFRCAEYLDALGTANQSASNERKQVGIVGGFASAVMGITGASAKAIAGVATTFGFAGTSMDAFTNTFLFSDASKSVTKLVRDSQRTYVAAVQDQLASLDYAGAVALLTGYEQTCRPAEIRRLIDEAVTSAKVVAESPGAQSTDGQVFILLGNLTAALGQPINEGQAITLFAWFGADSTKRSAIEAASPTLFTSLSPGPALEGKLRPFFLQYQVKGNAIAQRWADALAHVGGGNTGTPAGPQAAGVSVPVLRIQ